MIQVERQFISTYNSHIFHSRHQISWQFLVEEYSQAIQQEPKCSQIIIHPRITEQKIFPFPFLEYIVQFGISPFLSPQCIPSNSAKFNSQMWEVLDILACTFVHWTILVSKILLIFLLILSHAPFLKTWAKSVARKWQYLKCYFF